MLFNKNEITTILSYSQMIKSRIYDLFKTHASQYGISVPQLLVIFSIGNDEVHNVKELANHFSLQATNSSSLCKKMSDEGLIRRERNSVDVRIVNLYLSDKGRNIYLELSQYLERKMLTLNKEQIDIQKIITGLIEMEKLITLLGE